MKGLPKAKPITEKRKRQINAFLKDAYKCANITFSSYGLPKMRYRPMYKSPTSKEVSI